MINNRGLNIGGGYGHPPMQSINREKRGVINLQSNRLSRWPGKLIVPLFLFSGLFIFQGRTADNKSPNQTLAVKCSGCGFWPRPPERDKQGFWPYRFQLAALRLVAWMGTTKKSPPCNMTGTTYLVRLLCVASATPKGWPNTGEGVIPFERSRS